MPKINRRKALMGIAGILATATAPAFIPLEQLMKLPVKRTPGNILVYADVEKLILKDTRIAMQSVINRLWESERIKARTDICKGLDINNQYLGLNNAKV